MKACNALTPFCISQKYIPKQKGWHIYYKHGISIINTPSLKTYLLEHIGTYHIAFQIFKKKCCLRGRSQTTLTVGFPAGLSRPGKDPGQDKTGPRDRGMYWKFQHYAGFSL